MIRWVQDELPKFLAFCAHTRLATKELGVITLSRMLSSQMYLVREIFQGLDDGIHDFLVLKARQLGVSSVLWALDLWWLQRFEAIQGLYVTDDGANTEVHRRIIMEMYSALPPRFKRGATDVNNRVLLEWKDAPGWHASRLMWEHANADKEGQLGRSRGINFVHAEELDSWKDDPKSLVLATEHPHRLYMWVGTGQGYQLLYEMWDQAERALTRKRIFIGWWRLDTNRIDPEAKPELWRVYGRPRVTPEERQWMREVERLFDVEVTQEQLAWWRMTMSEAPNINGELATMLQEHPWFPEQSFQAAGSQFLSSSTMLRMSQEFRRAPKAKGYRFDWGPTFDAKGDDVLTEIPVEQAATGGLVVWQEVEPAGVYVVAGDPAYGSSEKADRFAATVWRCYPDKLVQVAEYCNPIGTMYQFAWVLSYLSGYYPHYLIQEFTGPGIAVSQEMKRMREMGFGLTVKHGQLRDTIGNIQRYLYMKPDAMSPSPAWDWKTSQERKEQIMEQLRDCCERGALIVRSKGLWNELGALRREGTKIEAGGVAHDDLAITAAMATEHWLSTIVQEIEEYLAPKDAVPTAETDPTQRLIRRFMRNHLQRDEDDPPKPLYGVRGVSPGR